MSGQASILPDNYERLSRREQAQMIMDLSNRGQAALKSFDLKQVDSILQAIYDLAVILEDTSNFAERINEDEAE